MSLTVGSLCSGIGCFDAAFERAGCEIRWQVEIDPHCQTVLQPHFPGVRRLGDIREAGAHNLEPVDVVVAGWPCQGVSTAGLRRGLADARSGLFWEVVRLVDELSPSYLVWENVPGLLSTCSCRECGRRCGACDTLAGPDDTECAVCGSTKLRGRVLPDHRGADFFTVVSALGFVGMDGAWTLLDSQWFGVAQRRQRLFGVFAQRHLGAERCAEILSFAARLSGHPPPRRETGTGVAALTANGVGTCGADDNQAQAGHLLSSLQGGGRRGHRVDAEQAADGQRVVHPTGSVDVASSLTSGSDVADPLTSSSSKSADSADRNAGPVNLVYQCHGSNVGPMGTLRAGNGNEAGGVPFVTHALTAEGSDASEDGTGRGTPLVVSLRGREGGATAELGGEQSTALRASQGGGDKAHVLIPQAFDDPRRFDAGGVHGGGDHGEVHPTLRNTNPNVLLAFDTTQITSDKNYSQPRAGDPCHPLAAGAHAPAIAGNEKGAAGWGVRRLTPL